MKKIHPLFIVLAATVALAACSDDQAAQTKSEAAPPKMGAAVKIAAAKTAKVEPDQVVNAFKAPGKKENSKQETKEQLMSVAPGKRMKPHAGGNPHANLGPQKMLNIALQHLAEKRPDEAMRSLAKGLYKYPDDHQMRGVRASLYLRAKSYAKALADLEIALKLKPEDPLLLINRAQAYRGFRRTNDAMNDLNKAIEVAPKMMGAYFNRGAIYFEQKKYAKAKVDFEKCVDINPHAAAPRFNLAMTKDVMGQRKEAISELEQFLKVTKHGGWRAIAEKQLANWGKPVKKAEVPKEPPAVKTAHETGKQEGPGTKLQAEGGTAKQ